MNRKLIRLKGETILYLRSRESVPIRALVPLLAVISFMCCALFFNVHVRGEQQFSYLARAFLQGHLGFQQMPAATWGDTTPANGRYYWPLGPFPAILLMPFVALAELANQFFYQGYLQPIILIVVLIAIIRICKRLGYEMEDSLYLAFGFAFSTAFLGVAMWPWSWYFSHVISCALCFGVILEMIQRRRPWVLGIYFALLLATRLPAALGIFWCVGEALLMHDSPRKKWKFIIPLIAPCLVMAAALMVYNDLRFANPFEQGYSAQLIPSSSDVRRAIGLVSFKHFPMNIYTLLLETPLAVRGSDGSLTFPYFVSNPSGMSIWITSPLLLFLFSLRFRDRSSLLILTTCFLIALPVLGYYGVGDRQFGYRYSLDFLPFLYFVFLLNYRKQRGNLSRPVKFVVLLSGIFNLFLFLGNFVWRIGSP